MNLLPELVSHSLPRSEQEPVGYNGNDTGKAECNETTHRTSLGVVRCWRIDKTVGCVTYVNV